MRESAPVGSAETDKFTRTANREENAPRNKGVAPPIKLRNRNAAGVKLIGAVPCRCDALTAERQLEEADLKIPHPIPAWTVPLILSKGLRVRADLRWGEVQINPLGESTHRRTRFKTLLPRVQEGQRRSI